MEFEKMTIDELEARRAEIAQMAETEGVDLDALMEEARGIKAELENRKNAEAARAEIRKAVADGEGVVVRTFIEEKGEKKTMTIEELRSSKEYLEAWKKDMINNNDEECRKLMTVNETVTPGTVPVPTYVEGAIRTAWEKLGLMNLVRKTYIPGNLNIGFEISGSDAAIHTEGADAPDEETLTLGIASLIPQSIKKWITVTDEAVDLNSNIVDYVYDELTYRIAKAAQEVLLAIIAAAPTTATSSAASVAEIESDGTDLLSIVAQCMSELSDEANDPVIVMNKKTYAGFIAARNGADYAVDPFMGLPVFFDATLGEIGNADGDPWLIVGDFGVGAHANFPNGNMVTIKYDDLSLAEADLVKIVGREFVGMNIVRCGAFARVVPTESE